MLGGINDNLKPGGSGLYQWQTKAEPHHSVLLLKEVLQNQRTGFNTELGETVGSQRMASLRIMRFFFTQTLLSLR